MRGEGQRWVESRDVGPGQRNNCHPGVPGLQGRTAVTPPPPPEGLSYPVLCSRDLRPWVSTPHLHLWVPDTRLPPVRPTERGVCWAHGASRLDAGASGVHWEGPQMLVGGRGRRHSRLGRAAREGPGSRDAPRLGVPATPQSQGRTTETGGPLWWGDPRSTARQCGGRRV